ncbi:MAG: 3-keto-5-aminohexanoate cleavage protein [Pseudomonadota bacterium]|nr:3-keto-5-aminohexanoate cleavage protein [Pseudomonadota bacterium]
MGLHHGKRRQSIPHLDGLRIDHTPTLAEYLLITPNKIAEHAAVAAEAGASFLHFHARDLADNFENCLDLIQATQPEVVNIRLDRIG